MEPMLEQCMITNKELPKNKLTKLTWGNASVVSDNRDYIVIKPSGVPFEYLQSFQMSIVELETGKHISGLLPSVDTEMHLEIYRQLPEVKAIIHTHSTYATSWAQAQKPIPCLGTTHCDYFMGEIPIIPLPTKEQFHDYETNTGKLVADYYKSNSITIEQSPAVLLPLHGCLAFGNNLSNALEVAIALEEIAFLAFNTVQLKETWDNNGKELFKKHYDRKHGSQKYYGQ